MRFVQIQNTHMILRRGKMTGQYEHFRYSLKDTFIQGIFVKGVKRRLNHNSAIPSIVVWFDMRMTHHPQKLDGSLQYCQI